jgi:hypothetical protein
MKIIPTNRNVLLKLPSTETNMRKTASGFITNIEEEPVAVIERVSDNVKVFKPGQVVYYLKDAITHITGTNFAIIEDKNIIAIKAEDTNKE